MGELAGRHVVVTGGAGFIGSHLVSQLVDDESTNVTVIDDLSTGSVANLPEGAPNLIFVKGDCCDPEVAAQVAGADLVFHLAVRNVRASISNPRENLRVNAAGTLEVLEAMRQGGGYGRFVYVSSSEVYGATEAPVLSEDKVPAPTTVYGAAKLAGEHLALAYHRTYGMDTCVVRPFNNYGPRSHFEGDSGEVIPKFILRALAGRPLLVHGDGTQTRDFIYVADTAAWLTELAALRALTGRVVNIAYGREVAVNDLAATIVAATGSSSEIAHVEPRPGDLPRLLADVTLARGLSDFVPRTGLMEGLRSTIDYFASLGDVDLLLELEREQNWT